MNRRRLSLALISAPSNLGLKPLRHGHEPGTWRAPSALLAAGLAEVLDPVCFVEIARPSYASDAEIGTSIRNGHAIRAFNLMLADAVQSAFEEGRFPFVVGGDCSVLLGALAGVRRSVPLSLIHIDGHSDFRHPGNYDTASMLGAAAGMDLALATGRGEPLLTDWPDVSAPLVPDEAVFQIGERESRDADFPWPDIASTAITRLDVFQAGTMSAIEILAQVNSLLDRRMWPFWLHLDVDVLDQALMPAVDSPGSPGLDPDVLTSLLGALMQDFRCAGMTLTVFDPDLDRDGRHARTILDLIGSAFSPGG